MAPTLDIIISHDDGPFTAGQPYDLTCTVMLENAAGTPTVEWLDPNNNPLDTNSDIITVGDTVPVNCFTYTTTLQFTTLFVSHGGQYRCQATLGGVNNTATTNITVQSKECTVINPRGACVDLCVYVCLSVCASVCPLVYLKVPRAYT